VSSVHNWYILAFTIKFRCGIEILRIFLTKVSSKTHRSTDFSDSRKVSVKMNEPLTIDYIFDT
jgi:hypothetical protein